MRKLSGVRKIFHFLTGVKILCSSAEHKQLCKSLTSHKATLWTLWMWMKTRPCLMLTKSWTFQINQSVANLPITDLASIHSLASQMRFIKMSYRTIAPAFWPYLINRAKPYFLKPSPKSCNTSPNPIKQVLANGLLLTMNDVCSFLLQWAIITQLVQLQVEQRPSGLWLEGTDTVYMNIFCFVIFTT